MSQRIEQYPVDEAAMLIAAEIGDEWQVRQALSLSTGEVLVVYETPRQNTPSVTRGGPSAAPVAQGVPAGGLLPPDAQPSTCNKPGCGQTIYWSPSVVITTKDGRTVKKPLNADGTFHWDTCIAEANGG